MHDESEIAARLDQLAEDFVAKLKAGERPQIATYAEAHPTLARDIEQLFPTLLVFEKLKPTAEELRHQRTEDCSTSGFPNISSYRLLREIGRGGMGVVYEAEHVALQRRVALKILPQGSSHDLAAVQRFELEARAAAALHHAQIVPVFDVGRDGDYCYYSMQLIEGDGLDRVIEEVRRIRSGGSDVPERPYSDSVVWLTGVGTAEQNADHVSSDQKRSNDELTNGTSGTGATITSINTRGQYFRQVAELGIQTADALAHAHLHSVIHRDIKPSNLLLDSSGNIWVTDFGLAKLADSDLTQTGNILGTLRYMSPERFDGNCDASADIYALGATLYELITLQPVFSSKDHLSLMKEIRTQQPATPQLLDSSIPMDLQTIVLKALEKEPGRRYASALAMSEDLERFLSGRPIKARRVTNTEKLWLWAKGNRRLAVSLSLLVLLFVLSAIGSTIAAWHFRDLANQNGVLAREKAEQQRVAVSQRDEARLNAYYADMQQAQQDWNNGQLRRMLETLRRYLPPPSGQDIRKWEWYYLLSLAHQDEQTLVGHEAPVMQVRWAPDGKRLFSASSDGTLRIWTAQGNEVQRIAIPHIVGFALGPDAKQVVTASDDSVLRFWDVEGGQLLNTIPTGLVSISSLDWSRRGDRIVVVPTKDDEPTVVLDSKTGDVVFRATVPSITDAKISPDGKHLATFLAYANKVWNLESGRVVAELANDVGEEDSQLLSLDWHPDGRRFVTGSFETGGRLYEIDPSKTFAKLLGRFDRNASFEEVRFSPDGTSIAAGSRSQSVEVYDTDSQERKVSLKGHIGWVASCDWHPQLPKIASAGLDGTIKIWNSLPKQPAPLLSDDYFSIAHQFHGTQSGSSSDGRWRWTWDVDAKTAEIHDATTGKSVLRISDVIHHGRRHPINFLPDSNSLIVKTHPHKLAIWDTSSWTEDPVLLVDPFGASGGPVYSWNGDFLAAGNGDGHFLLVNLRTKSAQRIHAHEKKLCVAVSGDGKQAVTACYGEVKLWDCQTATVIASLFGHAPGKYLARIAWGKNRLFATTGEDQTICIWDAGTGNLLQKLRGHQSMPTGLYFSADDSRLISTAKNTKVWEVATGRELLSFPPSSVLPDIDGFENVPQQAGFHFDDATLQFHALRKLVAHNADDVTNDFQLKTLLRTVRRILLRDDPTPKDVERCLALAHQAAGLAPNDPTCRKLLAYAQLKNGLFEAATANLKRALVSAPDDIESRLIEVMLLGQAGKQKRAEEKLAQAIGQIEQATPSVDATLRDRYLLLHEAAQFVFGLTLQADALSKELVVTTTVDELNGPERGGLSLREAILCASPGDTVAFSVRGTIQLRLGPLFLEKSLSIRGPGLSELTIDAGGASRVFRISDRRYGLSSEVSISHIHLTGGIAPQEGIYDDLSNRGGAIFTREDLTMTNVLLDHHEAQRGGAIWVDDGSTTKLVACTFSDNLGTNAGGAICICGARWGNPATVEIRRSTFSNNSGGAIYSYGRLFVRETTIHGNVAEWADQGNEWLGGGIAASKHSQDLVVEDCTVTDNLGGGIGLAGPYIGRDGKLVELESYAPGVIRNSIVYGNTKQGKPADIGPSFTNVEGIVIVSNTLYGSATGIIDGSNNLTGVDPQLGPLTDNGGATKTRALLKGSPAIDAGASIAAPITQFDQRGEPFLRIQNGDTGHGKQIDIGAFEFRQD